MRIRKRQVPLPLSSLLPVPLSDLYFNHSPTLVTDANGPSSSLHLSPPLLSPPPTTTSDQLIHGDEKKKMKKKQKNEKALYDDDDSDDYDDDDVDFDVKSMDASTSKNITLPRKSNSSSTQVTRSVKVDTLRKRRCVSFEEDDDDNEEGKKGIRKKGRRSSLLEEGSRCSRVNGRGWRCCQQTLVGYSLCEHHLGKGRLRSIKTTPSLVKKKRVKLGMVKARSISSLLGQTSSTSVSVVAAAAGESEISATADHFVEYDDN